MWVGGYKIQDVSIDLWEVLDQIFKDPQWIINKISPPQDGDSSMIRVIGGVGNNFGWR